MSSLDNDDMHCQHKQPCSALCSSMQHLGGLELKLAVSHQHKTQVQQQIFVEKRPLLFLIPAFKRRLQRKSILFSFFSL